MDLEFLKDRRVVMGLGGALALVLGIGLAQLIGLFVPALPVHTPLSFVLLAEALASLRGTSIQPTVQPAQLSTWSLSMSE